MRNAWKTAIVWALAWLASAGTSYAGGGSWLDQLSGPGPFTGPLSPTWSLFCVYRDDNGLRTKSPRIGQCEEPWTDAAAQRRKLDAVKGVLRFRYTYLGSSRNDLFADADASENKVHLQLFEFVFATRITSTLDIGAGVGFDRFHGEKFNSFWATSLKPLEITWTPLAAFSDDPRFRFLQIATGLQAFASELNQSDFCNGGNDCTGLRPFSTKGEYSWSVNTIIDFGYFHK